MCVCAHSGQCVLVLTVVNVCLCVRVCVYMCVFTCVSVCMWVYFHFLYFSCSQCSLWAFLFCYDLDLYISVIIKTKVVSCDALINWAKS